MRNPLATALLVLMVGCGFSGKIKKLESYEKDHYYALKVWMEKADQKAYFKLKTATERDAWLKANGFWDRFYQYDERQRTAILNGDVAVGFKQDQVFMAWGEPHQRNRLTGRAAERSELLTYRFEVDDDGNVLVWVPNSKTANGAAEKYALQLYMDDAVVTEIVRKDGWE